MKFNLEIRGNIYNFMRKCGYYFEGEENGELAFLRQISNSLSGYPRFHIYSKINNVSRETTINLHLDQKKPIYKGTPAHAGERRGKVIEREAERIRRIADKKE